MNAYVTMSAEAAELRAAYDAEGMSNPIGIFLCPHCHQAADVEYGFVFHDFPSGREARHAPDHMETARCFRCNGVSYWNWWTLTARMTEVGTGATFPENCFTPQQVVFAVPPSLAPTPALSRLKPTATPAPQPLFRRLQPRHPTEFF